MIPFPRALKISLSIFFLHNSFRSNEKPPFSTRHGIRTLKWYKTKTGERWESSCEMALLLAFFKSLDSVFSSGFFSQTSLTISYFPFQFLAKSTGGEQKQSKVSLRYRGIYYTKAFIIISPCVTRWDVPSANVYKYLRHILCFDTENTLNWTIPLILVVC